MSTTRTALVIGGGIAGPVTAMALAKAGITATVHEAYDSTADGIGGGLSIAANGQNALAVIDAQHLVTDIGDRMDAIVLQSWTGKDLATFRQSDGLPPARFVWRADLYRTFYDEARRRGIEILHGKRFVGYDETAEGITARFADGSTATADILIGADGIRSAVRPVIDPAAPRPRYTGLVSFGGPVEDTGLPPTDGRWYMAFGKRAFFGYAINEDRSGGWFVNLPRTEATPLEAMRAVPAEQTMRMLRDTFAGDRTAAPRLLERTRPEDVLVVGPMEDLPKVPTWSRGRAVLVGDAAHAPSSSSGQGASIAIESAVELALCLRDLPYDRAFAAFEARRRQRVEKIIAAGARTNSNKAAGPVARMLRDLTLPVLMKMMAKPEKSDWQFGYRIRWDEPATVPA